MAEVQDENIDTKLKPVRKNILCAAVFRVSDLKL